MMAKRVFWILLAGTVLAGCATVPVVEHGWLPLTSGTGRFYLTKKYYPAREGGTYIYSTRFYYGSSGFFSSEAFTIQKIVSPGETYYVLAIDLARRHYSIEHSILLEADGSSWRLRDNNPQTDYTHLGFVRFEERMRFRLDPAMVAQLASAAHIGIYELAGPINLTFRQRGVLQSFLKDTAGPGPF
jgi:hypothetical protein